MEIHSSPRSSTGGVDSFKGTLDTRLTTFSQHESFNKSINLPKGPGRSDFITSPVNVPVKESSNAFSGLDKDPFVTSVHGVSTRLSPTASAFSPFHANATLSVSTNAPPIASAVSTDMGLSRDLNISSSMPLSAQEVDIWLTELHSVGGHWHGARYLTTLKGHVFIHFTDIRDSCSIHTRICLTMKEWKSAYIFPEHLTKDNTFSYEASVARTGQVFVVAVVPFNSSVSTISAMEAACQTLQSHGRLFAFVRQSIFSDGCFKAVAEFCDTSAAHHAMASCNNITTFEGVRLSVTPYYTDCTSTSDLIEAMQDISFAKGQSGFDPHYSAPGSIKPRQRPPHDAVAQESYPTYPLISQPPLGSNMPYMLDTVISTIHLNATGPLTPLSSPYSVGGRVYKTPPSPALTAHNGYSPSRNLPGVNRVDARRQNAMRISRSPYHNLASHHNQVEINRIRDGIDVRTTIMLRNIPNKVDQTMLKRIVDESSWGKYDFMYLRIDFANDCNVGYAFINFVDPLDITDFVEARGNQRWNCFKSDKIAEISYATIQGKDCLVQKFRNSSVMLEAPHYRPKLYFTSNGPMPEFAGQEEPFPEPDNQSKMKRSCENAEHVGLFTPNAGQHFRDEQRRRRSQYDRGTRLAALEEYDYEAALQHLYDPSNH